MNERQEIMWLLNDLVDGCQRRENMCEKEYGEEVSEINWIHTLLYRKENM